MTALVEPGIRIPGFNVCALCGYSPSSPSEPMHMIPGRVLCQSCYKAWLKGPDIPVQPRLGL